MTREVHHQCSADRSLHWPRCTLTTVGSGDGQVTSGGFQPLVQRQPLGLQPSMLARQRFLALPELADFDPTVIAVDRRIGKLRLDLLELRLQFTHPGFDLLEARTLLP